MPSKEHWERVYSTKATDAVSWFQTHPETSLRLIEQTGVSVSAAIIDVGGGASTLVDDLLSRNYTNITVLDLSAAALRAAQTRLGSRAKKVTWLEADITKVELALHAYDLWHDRAVFHFLTKEDDRHAYVRAVLRAVKPGGHVIVATFAEERSNSMQRPARYALQRRHPACRIRCAVHACATRQGGSSHSVRYYPTVHVLLLPHVLVVSGLRFN